MTKKSNVQGYPRKDGLLDTDTLPPHSRKITPDELREIVLHGISEANRKSSRAILNLAEGLSDDEVVAKYRRSGKELFTYFKQYCGDPASTAHQCFKRTYQEVAKEQFRNRTLQKERMNSGWRYQYIAKDAARKSNRFHDISDVGTIEADFNVTMEYLHKKERLSIYVSVKNRSNTMGGQDWPKAIAALEEVAISDRNRTGDYLCVFGIAMERGERLIKRRGRTQHAYSSNTEVWKSDFFWPFFTNCAYEEIVTAVLDALIATQKPETLDVPIPGQLIESFGECCSKAGLIDADGCFHDPHKLARFFCGVK